MSMSKPLQALWWLRKGEFRVGPEWEEAHRIVQAMEGTAEFDWVHALLHWIEADMFLVLALWTERSQEGSFSQPLFLALWTKRSQEGSLNQPLCSNGRTKARPLNVA